MGQNPIAKGAKVHLQMGQNPINVEKHSRQSYVKIDELTDFSKLLYTETSCIHISSRHWVSGGTGIMGKTNDF